VLVSVCKRSEQPSLHRRVQAHAQRVGAAEHLQLQDQHGHVRNPGGTVLGGGGGLLSNIWTKSLTKS
jgi:hypothetical protein